MKGFRVNKRRFVGMILTGFLFLSFLTFLPVLLQMTMVFLVFVLVFLLVVGKGLNLSVGVFFCWFLCLQSFLKSNTLRFKCLVNRW